MPPVKELRYFYEYVHYPSETLRQRFSLNGDWHNLDYREQFKEFTTLLKHARREAIWYMRFLFGKRSDDWYLSLFPTRKISGDISPQYLSLPVESIVKIKELLPNVKVLIFLRNPVDWSWSFAKMSLIRNRSLDELPEVELLRFFTEYQAYYPTAATIDRWQFIFSKNQLFIGFYDKLCDDPQGFYDDICDFIEVDRHVPVLDRVNPGTASPMPNNVRSFLQSLWREEITCLASNYAPYPQRWLINTN